ncbi:MAG: hypothetical protein KJ904_12250 [Alphaproteobacteria bacterium]|nr:hypothetical protein [Alphaproteobacteria bacterium]MBU0797120.1 hypothetical protein [Alphaproteobacteria bacterium]MBU0887927.1 hypothetical protein [Alphaproteobacteria bacterium]MBU1814850.1 hypothetical protein [Alphaproteobacteria bacterium]MBU2091316.1 hypothetical protein [Alphaproteobacteria bacterium]
MAGVELTGLAVIGMRSDKQQALVTAQVVTQALQNTKQLAQQAAAAAASSGGVNIVV